MLGLAINFRCSFRHYRRQAPPHVTSVSSARFPSICIDQRNIVREPRLPVFGQVRFDVRQVERKRRAARKVEIHLVRRVYLKGWPGGSWAGLGAVRRGTVGDSARDRWVVLCDEVAPDLHHRIQKVGALIGRSRAKEGGKIRSVNCNRHRVLILVRGSSVVAVGFRHPICGTYKRGFRIDSLPQSVTI